MGYIILFLASFLVVYLAYLLTVILNKKKLEKFKTSNQALIFVKRYKLKLTDKNVKLLATLIALSNAFIIATAITIVELIKNIILKLIVAFLVIIPLILILYSLIGKYMLKKENR